MRNLESLKEVDSCRGVPNLAHLASVLLGLSRASRWQCEMCLFEWIGKSDENKKDETAVRNVAVAADSAGKYGGCWGHHMGLYN